MQWQEARMIAPCPAVYVSQQYNYNNRIAKRIIFAQVPTLVQIPDLQAHLAFHNTVL